MNDLEKVFLSELEDIYDGEQQLVKALPEMEKNAESQELKSAIHEHLEQTKNHVNRLERVFRDLGQTPKRRGCKGMEGIIDEGEMLAREFKGNSALDAALIVAGQKVEHYEITSYGSLCTWAKELGRQEALSLLKENLSEEKATDEKLTRLAESARNPEAARHDTSKQSESASKMSKIASTGP
ncbi:MAG TPA: ferritin-like domain-containing protein [Clostridia bacterium]|nr:ferritin-like domain-containing protein [Clostridia bacterium]